MVYKPVQKCPPFTRPLMAAMLVAILSASNFALSQSSARKASPPPNTAATLPEWGITDDEFKSLLLQVETILPIYESSLKETEAYLSERPDISYQTGKMIQDDIGTLRTDIAGTRKTVSSKGITSRTRRD